MSQIEPEPQSSDVSEINPNTSENEYEEHGNFPDLLHSSTTTEPKFRGMTRDDVDILLEAYRGRFFTLSEAEILSHQIPMSIEQICDWSHKLVPLKFKFLNLKILQQIHKLRTEMMFLHLEKIKTSTSPRQSLQLNVRLVQQHKAQSTIRLSTSTEMPGIVTQVNHTHSLLR